MRRWNLFNHMPRRTDVILVFLLPRWDTVTIGRSFNWICGSRIWCRHWSVVRNTRSCQAGCRCWCLLWSLRHGSQTPRSELIEELKKAVSDTYLSYVVVSFLLRITTFSTTLVCLLCRYSSAKRENFNHFLLISFHHQLTRTPTQIRTWYSNSRCCNGVDRWVVGWVKRTRTLYFFKIC